MSRTVPLHMNSTVELLRRAYPDGMPNEDRPVLMALMKDTSMSDRSVAMAFGYYYDQPYEYYLHDAATCAMNPLVTEESKLRVRKYLNPFGFEQWANEE